MAPYKVYFGEEKVLTIEDIPTIEGFIIDENAIKAPTNNPQAWLQYAVIGYIKDGEIYILKSNYGEKYYQLLAKLKNK